VAAVFKVHDRVQEIAPPHRRGSVRVVRGSGVNATIVVNLDGHPPTSFRPAQLERI
jgi:hypothetical protein